MTAAPLGTLFVISAASGAGKTSLVRAMMETTPAVRFSVSHTTRAPRPGERDGHDYHFVDVARFRHMIDAGDFLEHAQVFDNYYGTARAEVATALTRGEDVFLDIDWQGARQVRSAYPDAVTIFVLPPSREVLEARLRGRGQDADDVIARRMDAAIRESSHYDEYDFVIINEDFTTAVADLTAVVRARRLRGAAQVQRHRELLAALLAEKP